MCACVRVYVGLCLCAHVHVCVCACACAGAGAGAGAGGCVCMRVCTHKWAGADGIAGELQSSPLASPPFGAHTYSLCPTPTPSVPHQEKKEIENQSQDTQMCACA